MISQKLEFYTQEHSSDEDPLLHELFRETNLKVMYPRMLSGHIQGKLLEMVSQMIRPTFVLEIGTYTGYSAICLAKGLMPAGKLVTIEINPELIDFSSKYFKKAGISESIIQKAGSALEVIPTLDFEWDLVFIDADKENYLNYYNMVVGKVKKGGFIIADNVLWGGKVLEPEAKQDKETKGIVEFNKYVKQDDRVDKVMLSVRDGLMLLRKK